MFVKDTLNSYGNSEKSYEKKAKDLMPQCYFFLPSTGKTATHAIVYAQLYTPDGQHHGLNGFWVPVRDPKTLEPFAGVIVGDLGEKIGLNGLDNGFVMFNNYRIPKDFLLAKTGDISDDGQYMSPIKNNKKRIGASFGALSGGRVNICGILIYFIFQINSKYNKL